LLEEIYLPELDLHGLTQDEALAQVEEFLDRTFNDGFHEISIVHGKGTGVLRNAVRHYLKGHRMVRSFRQGYEWEGGSGATIVELAVK
jgi:DNA mismatch repair protein MutS2